MNSALGIRNVNDAQHLDAFVCGIATAEPFMQPDQFRDLLANGEHRIERCHRLLEDHRDLLAANLPHLFGREVQQVDAVIADLARDDAARRLADQPHDAERGDALAAAGFADDTKRFAGVDMKAHAIDGANHTPIGQELRLKVPHVQQRNIERRLGHGFSYHALLAPECRIYATTAVTPSRPVL